ncbi:MAG: hypothetical protein HUU26_10925 [Gemmatimonadaceae bacterium]|nr:hypothetical protein [Gemmatimonadaceae bacterium]
MRLTRTGLAMLLPLLPLGAQPTAPRLTLAEELRLDAGTEDFPTVTRVLVGPRGQIVVPINADMQLRVYDASGKKLGVVGRRGSGPGEFQLFGPIGWASDTMWVSDVQQQRTTFVGPDLKVLRTVLWPSSPGAIGGAGERLYIAQPYAFLSDGSVLADGNLAVETERGRQLSGTVRVRLTPGGPAQVVRRYPRTDDSPFMMNVAGFGRWVPFTLPLVVTARDDGRFAELSAPPLTRPEGTFDVAVFRASGDTLFARSYPFRGAPIPQAAKDSALASFVPSGGRVLEGPADLPQRFQAIARERMPAWYTPAEAVLLGLDLTTWVGMRPMAEGRSYLVLDRRGEPVGSLVVPRTTRVRQASATHVWVTETDADGLSSVVRYRISGLSCRPAAC